MGVGLRETPDALRRFAEEFGIRFPLWIDREGRSPTAFGVLGHPNTILLDREGRVVGRVRGERNWDTNEARRLVDALLAGDAKLRACQKMLSSGFGTRLG